MSKSFGKEGNSSCLPDITYKNFLYKPFAYGFHYYRTFHLCSKELFVGVALEHCNFSGTVYLEGWRVMPGREN